MLTKNKQDKLIVREWQSGVAANTQVEITPESTNCFIMGFQGAVNSDVIICYYKTESHKIFVSTSVDQVVYVKYITF